MLTPAQIEERRGYIGASEAAGVLGLSRWQTPLSIWAAKTGMLPPEDKSGELAIEVGNDLEDCVARLFAKRTGKQVRRVNETIRHPEYPFLAVNLDRKVVSEDADLECKTASAYKDREWEDDAIPVEYLIQCQHSMGVTGKKANYIACLIGGNVSFQYKLIERDDALIRDMFEKEIHFWNTYVVPKVMPQIVTARDAGIINRLYPEDPAAAPAVTLSADHDRIAAGIKAMEKDKKRIEELIEKEKNYIRLALGSATEGATAGYRLTWKEQSPMLLDQERLKSEAPTIYEKYLKPSPRRPLYITPIKPPKPSKT